MLESCSTGKGEDKEKNIANELTKVFSSAAHIFAPKASGSLEEIIFDRDNKIVDVRYTLIYDGKLPSDEFLKAHFLDLDPSLDSDTLHKLIELEKKSWGVLLHVKAYDAIVANNSRQPKDASARGLPKEVIDARVRELDGIAGGRFEVLGDPNVVEKLYNIPERL